METAHCRDAGGVQIYREAQFGVFLRREQTAEL